MTPVISVVIPTHNPRADYLARVIEALRGQTLPCEQWELLVVDNGSRVLLKAGMEQTAYGRRHEVGGGKHEAKGRRHAANSRGLRGSRSEAKTGRRGDQQTKRPRDYGTTVSQDQETKRLKDEEPESALGGQRWREAKPRANQRTKRLKDYRTT